MKALDTIGFSLPVIVCAGLLAACGGGGGGISVSSNDIDPSTEEDVMEETREETTEEDVMEETTKEDVIEETREETIVPPSLISSLSNSFDEEENAWKCVKGKCPVQSYGIWLQYSTHGIALVKRLIPEYLRADPNVDQSGPDGGGIITDADGYQHSETGVSYGQASNGNRIDAQNTTFTYAGSAVGTKDLSGGGTSYKSGVATINIQNSQTSQPIQVLIKLEGEPEWDWNYALGMVLEEGSFTYEKPSSLPGSVTERLTGQYYGPNHEEFGGIFIRDGWFGAYGGSKQ